MIAGSRPPSSNDHGWKRSPSSAVTIVATCQQSPSSRAIIISLAKKLSRDLDSYGFAVSTLTRNLTYFLTYICHVNRDVLSSKQFFPVTPQGRVLPFVMRGDSKPAVKNT